MALSHYWAVIMLERIERLAKQKEEQRRQTWQAIKEQAPDMAAFMTAINVGFGKPPALQVSLDGVEVISNGALIPEQQAWNGRIRKPAFEVRR